jgi:ABC-type bacteriocin/lantibiotic exporters, contain an N-terminal double-glycine peptidase domain
LRGFDRILVLQVGRIVEDGPPELLMSRAGAYRGLIDREIARLPQRGGSRRGKVRRRHCHQAATRILLGNPRNS